MVNWVRVTAIALIGLYAVMAWTGSLKNGMSFDEGLQLATGYNIWLNRDLRIEGANGDLVKRWATLPYLFSRPRFVDRKDPYWKAGVPYEIAHRFFFELGNRPESLLKQGRAMIVLLGIATGLLVFTWSKKLFGSTGGLISLGLFSFSPHMLAFGGLVSTDLSITLTLLAATWSIWHLLHRVTWPRTLASLVIFGLLVLAKPTALVILPIAAGLLLVRMLVRRPLPVRLGGREWSLTRRRAQAGVFTLMIGLHALAGWGAIWAHYTFRYSASPDLSDPSLKINQLNYRDGVAPPLQSALDWLQAKRILPEGFYRGVYNLVGNDDEIPSFMNGEWTVGGRMEFFPYAIWVKTSPALFVILLIGLGAWSYPRLRSPNPAPKEPGQAMPPGLYEVTPLLTLIGCYMAVAVTDDLNIGHRHVLPIYPALYILAGASAMIATGRRLRWKIALIGLALAGPAADSLAIRPNYLAYFGPQAGGAENGYKRLVDSSLDWGMGLPALRRWLDENDPQRKTPLFLAYFGTDSPRYHGIRAQRLPGFFDRRPVEPYGLRPGYYAISATLLQSVYTATVGPWSQAYEARYQEAWGHVRLLEQGLKDPRLRSELMRQTSRDGWTKLFYVYDVLRFARLCAWLRHNRKPDYQVAHSILIWDLSLRDLEEALAGPPAELTDDPIPERVFGSFLPMR